MSLSFTTNLTNYKPMKRITTIIKWSSCILLTTATLSAQETIEERKQRAEQVELFYSMAERAYEDGDIKAARESLRSALALNRSHAHSIALARKMRTGGNQTVLAKRKRIFNAVMVPRVELDEASLRDAIKVLAMVVEKESKGKVIPNFVIQDKHKVLDEAKITLKLRNVPAGDVLDHLLRSAGASASFGKYTTIIRPRKGTVASKAKEVKAETAAEPESDKDKDKDE